MTVVIGPLPCINCGRVVVWDRMGRQWRLMERVGKTLRKHRCPA